MNETQEKIKYRKGNQLCWSCGKPADYPQYMSTWFCKEHLEMVLKDGFSAVKFL